VPGTSTGLGFPERSSTTHQHQALILPFLFLVLQIYHGNPCKHARSDNVHVQYKSGLLFLNRLNCQLWIEPFPLFNDACASQRVVNFSIFLQCSLEQCNVIGIFGNVHGNKGNGRGRSKRGDESFSGFGCKIAKDNGSASLVEQADSGGSSAICTA
jgi:hypothetical protein